MLWVDKYRPKCFDELDLHPAITPTLRKLAAARDMPHLLLYGPSGSGKKTRVMALLREIYGEQVLSLKLEHKSVQVADSKSIEMTTLSSPFHIDINPSDAGNYDRVVIMQMIKEIAQSVPVNVSKTQPRFKVVVLNEAEKMTRTAQNALRRTMEKYMATCRIILIACSTSQIVSPLKSRCQGVRVAAHSQENIKACCATICSKEGVPCPSDAFIGSLTTSSSGNLRRAILMLEAARVQGVSFSGDGTDIPRPDWNHFVSEIARDILTEQSPRKLFEIRGKMYELLAQCVPGELLLKELLMALLSMVTPTARGAIVSFGATYNHNMRLGSKSILHLEAFVANAMKVIKAHNSR